MRKYEINVYSFDELSEDAKRVAIDDYYNDGSIQTERNNQFQDFAKEFIKELGFDVVSISYSFSYSQGDGFCFDIERMGTEQIIDLLNKIRNLDVEKGWKFAEETIIKMKEVMNKHFEVKKAEILLRKYNSQLIVEKQGSWNIYSNSSTRRTYIDAEVFDTPNFKEKDIHYINSVEFGLNNIYQLVCEVCETWGYEFFEERISNDDFNELSQANNWEYTIDGSLFTEM